MERPQQGPVLVARLRLGRDSLLGVVLIAAVAALMLWGLLGKPNPFSQQTSVWAEFPSAASFAKFDREVRVGGANVGTVGAVLRVGDHALVQLNFPASIGTIHADATAAIHPHTLFDGSAYVELWPGSPEAPALGDHRIPLTRTQDYVSVTDALSFAAAPTRRALQAVARGLGDALRAPTPSALRDSFKLSPALFQQLDPAAVAAGGPTQSELAGTIRGFAATSRALARADSSYAPLLRDAAATIAAIRIGSDTPLDRTIAAFPATLAAAQTGGAALTSTISMLRPLAVALTPGMRELTPTLTELGPLLRAARPALGAAVPFVGAVRASLAAAQRAAPASTALIGELHPLLDHLNQTLLPFLSSPGKAGPPLYRELLSFASSGDATMDPVQTLQQSGRNGSGHLWHIFARVLTGISGTPPCSTYASQLSALLLRLQLCTP
jgi:hypothetical protein